MARLLSCLASAFIGSILLLGCSKADSGIVGVDSQSRDDEEEDASAGECSPGEERCECGRDERCDEGLECRSGLCVEAERSDDDVDDAGSESDESDDDEAADDDESNDDDATGDDTADDDADDVEPEPEPASDDDLVEPEPTPEGGAGGTEPQPSGSGGAGAGGESGPGGAPPQGGTGGVASEGGSGGQTAAGGSIATGEQLIVNGDFSSDGSYWNVDDGYYAVPYTIASGALCVTLHSTQTFAAIGWPLDLAMALTLDTSRGYELRYEAWTNDPVYLTFEAKVGEAVSPFYAHFQAEISLSAAPTVYSHTFIPATGEPSGVVFLATWYYYASSSGQVCLDNVELRAL